MALMERARILGPDDNGMLMTPEEFDRADFDDAWSYELVNGVLIVTPLPLEEEVDPNEELGHPLRRYRDEHSEGHHLSGTLFERYVKAGKNRRRADRVIWAGLERNPRRGERPTIIVEFVSRRRRDRRRDYAVKSDEYMRAGIKEYWIIDRFDKTMTVITRARGKVRKQLIAETESYQTNLLPGFVLPLGRLLRRSEGWAAADD